LTQQNPKAERGSVVVCTRESAGWEAKMEVFNVITLLAFGATMTFAGVVLLCEQLLYYLS
jgi:hypothetical protein